MNYKTHNSHNFFRTDANHSRLYQHLYLRGNFKQEMFFDKVDMVNAWNRLWLSAEATGVQVVSAVILNNHFHLNGIFRDEDQRTRFKRHFRLSITQYHNRRYEVRGTLGTRTLRHADLKDVEDLRDCICYHLRNVLHHGITSNYLDYPYSTARYVFDLASADQQGFYTRETLPPNLASAYLPARVQLPKGWMMTREGLIVPPVTVIDKQMCKNMNLNSKYSNSSLTSNLHPPCPGDYDLCGYPSKQRSDRWHKARGFKMIGYHYVIRLDGTIEQGRPPEMVGAHCTGHNAHSIGICYIGGLAPNGRPKDTRTPEQKDSLWALVQALRRQYPSATVHGHREFANKDCPCFEVKEL